MFVIYYDVLENPFCIFVLRQTNMVFFFFVGSNLLIDNEGNLRLADFWSYKIILE
jgi:hypothetical protein